MSVRTFSGSPEQIRTSVNTIIREFKEQYGDYAVEIIDDPETSLDALTASVGSVPFLAQKKLVVIRAAASLQALSKGVDAFLNAVHDSVDVILTESAFDKRSAVYKKLAAETVFTELEPRTGRSLQNFVIDYAKSLHLPMTQAEAAYLIEQVGENEMYLQNEVVKLAAVGSADSTAIDTHVEKQPRSKVFDLLEAAIHKNSVRAEQLYEEQRAQKIEPQAILGMIIWQLQVLALAKTAPDTQSAVGASKIRSFPLEKARTVTRSLSYVRLTELVDLACDVDIAIKSGANPDEAVRLLLAELSR